MRFQCGAHFGMTCSQRFSVLLGVFCMVLLLFSLLATSIDLEIFCIRPALKKAEQHPVIVDMREFMCSLPNVLHQKGMRILPVSLEVGDYILSPLICVERKSVQDLFGSFTSGRLYHQIETMVRYYRILVLLIDFSEDKSFSFLVFTTLTTIDRIMVLIFALY